MFSLIMVNKSYDTVNSLKNVVNYVTHDKQGNLLRFCGAINSDVNHAIEDMLGVKRYYRKETGRQVRHFIVSFNENTKYNAFDLFCLGFQISGYYARQYQIVFGVHEDTDNLHIHFVFNTVSYTDGIMYSGGIEDMYRLKDYIYKLTKEDEIILQEI